MGLTVPDIHELEKAINHPLDERTVYHDGEAIEFNLEKLNLIQLPEHLRQFRHIIRLNLTANKLTRLPHWLSELPLEWLMLANNNIQELPERLEKLQYLDISSNNLEKIPKLEQYTMLKRLILNFNFITHIPDWFPDLNTITELQLYGNKLRLIPTLLCQMNHLEVLNIGCNMINLIPEEIGNFKRLQDLNCRNNMINQLPSEISELQTLESLDLSQNKLTRLADGNHVFPNLQMLDLSDNRIKDLEIDWYLPELRILNILNNPFKKISIEFLMEFENLAAIMVEKEKIDEKTIAYLKEMEIRLISE